MNVLTHYQPRTKKSVENWFLVFQGSQINGPKDVKIIVNQVFDFNNVKYRPTDDEANAIFNRYTKWLQERQETAQQLSQQTLNRQLSRARLAIGALVNRPVKLSKRQFESIREINELKEVHRNQLWLEYNDQYNGIHPEMISQPRPKPNIIARKPSSSSSSASAAASAQIPTQPQEPIIKSNYQQILQSIVSKLQPKTINQEQSQKNSVEKIIAEELNYNAVDKPIKKSLITFLSRFIRFSADEKDIVIQNANTILFGDRSLQDWYDNYLQQFDKKFPPAQKSSARKPLTPRPIVEMKFPFKSKVKAYTKLHNQPPNIDPTGFIEDFKIKPLKKLFRPYFSPTQNSYEIDYVFAQHPILNTTLQTYLFCININTKYLIVFPTKDRSATETLRCLNQLVNDYTIASIRGDKEPAFESVSVKRFFTDNKIKTYFTSSPFTQHNRVVDSVIRTIRNAFADRILDFSDPRKMSVIVTMYNRTPHLAFKNEYSPSDVQANPEIEGQYIRYQTHVLERIIEEQRRKGLMNYDPGNILLIHLDLSRTIHSMDKRRRQFNELASFVRYENGNVVCELLRKYPDLSVIEVPIYYSEKVAESINELPERFRKIL